MAQELGEPLDASIPQAFVAAEPPIGALERPRIDAAIMDPSTHGAFHEPGLLESLDVFRRGGERHAVRRGELADRLLALREALEHRAPGPVAQRAEDEIESCLLFNHAVEYIDPRPIVNHPVENHEAGGLDGSQTPVRAT